MRVVSNRDTSVNRLFGENDHRRKLAILLRVETLHPAMCICKRDNMKLKAWLRREGLSHAVFAAQLGVTRMMVYRYAVQDVKPRKDTGKRIVRLTKGDVSMEDIYL